MIEPIMGIAAITAIGLHIVHKPYTVTVAQGAFTPQYRKKSFRTYDDALAYSRTVNKDFKYVWIKFRDEVRRVTTTGKVERIKGSI